MTSRRTTINPNSEEGQKLQKKIQGQQLKNSKYGYITELSREFILSLTILSSYLELNGFLLKKNI